MIPRPQPPLRPEIRLRMFNPSSGKSGWHHSGGEHGGDDDGAESGHHVKCALGETAKAVVITHDCVSSGSQMVCTIMHCGATKTHVCLKCSRVLCRACILAHSCVKHHALATTASGLSFVARRARQQLHNQQQRQQQQQNSEPDLLENIVILAMVVLYLDVKDQGRLAQVNRTCADAVREFADYIFAPIDQQQLGWVMQVPYFLHSRTGPIIHTIDASHSLAVTTTGVFALLAHCRNLKTLLLRNCSHLSVDLPDNIETITEMARRIPARALVTLDLTGSYRSFKESIYAAVWVSTLRGLRTLLWGRSSVCVRDYPLALLLLSTLEACTCLALPAFVNHGSDVFVGDDRFMAGLLRDLVTGEMRVRLPFEIANSIKFAFDGNFDLRHASRPPHKWQRIASLCIECHSQRLMHLRMPLQDEFPLASFTGLVTLDLSQAFSCDLSSLRRFPHLKALLLGRMFAADDKSELTNNDRIQAAVVDISSCPTLQVLALSNWETIDRYAIYYLCINLEKLRHLALTNCVGISLGIQRFMQEFPKLYDPQSKQPRKINVYIDEIDTDFTNELATANEVLAPSHVYVPNPTRFDNGPGELLWNMIYIDAVETSLSQWSVQNTNALSLGVIEAEEINWTIAYDSNRRRFKIQSDVLATLAVNSHALDPLIPQLLLPHVNSSEHEYTFRDANEERPKSESARASHPASDFETPPRSSQAQRSQSPNSGSRSPSLPPRRQQSSSVRAGSVEPSQSSRPRLSESPARTPSPTGSPMRDPATPDW